MAGMILCRQMQIRCACTQLPSSSPGKHLQEEGPAADHCPLKGSLDPSCLRAQLDGICSSSQLPPVPPLPPPPPLLLLPRPAASGLFSLVGRWLLAHLPPRAQHSSARARGVIDRGHRRGSWDSSCGPHCPNPASWCWGSVCISLGPCPAATKN